jgi:3-oxoacyl-[acyl-carrier-protein] synthase-3
VANLKPEDLDLILVATCTPDFLLPSNASIVQDKLGIKEIAVVDIRYLFDQI